MTRSDRNALLVLALAFLAIAAAGAFASRGAEGSAAAPAAEKASAHPLGVLEKLFTPLPVDPGEMSDILDEGGGDRPRAPALPPETRALLARRHAPEMRFNAWFPMPDPSDAHRTEDFYPASVERFFGAIGLGAGPESFPREVEVIRRRSSQDVPALRARVTLWQAPAWHAGLLREYPYRMPGDPPGSAPIYADVYPDPLAPSRTAFFEAWVFYPTDISDARLARAWTEVGGHRSDWEHASFELDISLGPARSRIVRAVYFGHEAAFEVEGPDLEVVDGTHPVVYVSQGKHASYPAAGEWRDYFRSDPFLRFDDVFHGNGARVRSWEGEIVDIARAARPRQPWLAHPERWGGEDERILGVPWCTSSLGPWFHSESNDRFTRITGSWRDAMATHPGLRLDRDRGIEAPRVAVPPAAERGW